jgi:hypothetical protein
MRKYLFTAILLLFFCKVQSQQQFEDGDKWGVTITGALLPLPDFNTGIQPGVQYWISDRFSVLTEFTIKTGRRNNPDSSAFNKKYFRIQPEIRYSFFGRRTGLQAYVGIRFAYAFRKFDDYNNGFFFDNYPGDSLITKYDKASINSPVKTLSLQMGLVLFHQHPFSVDIFFGVGGRFINTKYTAITNPQPGQRLLARERPLIVQSYLYKDNIVLPHFNFGLRGAWRFGQ